MNTNKALITVITLALLGASVFFGLIILDSKYNFWNDIPVVTPKDKVGFDIESYILKIQSLNSEITSLEKKKTTIDDDIANLKQQKLEIVAEVNNVLKNIQSQINQ